MNLKQVGNNMTELELADGMRVLISYQTPVAVFIVGQGVIKTSKKWSATTTSHINKWIRDYSAYVTVNEKPQEYFDSLLMGVK